MLKGEEESYSTWWGERMRRQRSVTRETRGRVERDTMGENKGGVYLSNAISRIVPRIASPAGAAAVVTRTASLAL